jgi:hypothetical protein
MTNAELGILLQVISLLGAALLCFRLFQTGLWRRYPVFFWYFIFRVPDSTWPLLMDTSSTPYQHVWMLTEPITWIFHILVVIELYRLVLEGHKGIYTLGRWAMYAALAIAIPVSILSLTLHFTSRTPERTKYMGYEFATARGIDFCLALFLLLILFFLSRYPMKLSRNVVVHAALYTILFFTDAFAVFLRTFRIVATPTASNVLIGFSCACTVAWLILLSPKGEEVQANLPSISPQRERNALRQLESLNATLLKVSGK